MTSEIHFCMRAPTRQIWFDSWVAANILDADGTIKPQWSELVLTEGSWVDHIVKDGVIIPGWHCNAKAYGQLAIEMTWGLEQYNEDGTPKNVFDRTWAKEVFGLTWHDADPISGAPAGYANAALVHYYDPMDLSSPSNVIL